MIEKQQDGRYLLSFECNAIIRRVPIPRYGTSKSGRDWSLGSVLVEAYEEDESASAQLFLITWDELMIEQIERLGVGKKVKIKYHLEVKERFDSYNLSAIIDDISLATENENFLIGKKKGE